MPRRKTKGKFAAIKLKNPTKIKKIILKLRNIKSGQASFNFVDEENKPPDRCCIDDDVELNLDRFRRS